MSSCFQESSLRPSLRGGGTFLGGTDVGFGEPSPVTPRRLRAPLQTNLKLKLKSRFFFRAASARSVREGFVREQGGQQGGETRRLKATLAA